MRFHPLDTAAVTLPPAVAAVSALPETIAFDGVATTCYDDGLSAPDCLDLPTCRSNVRSFHAMASSARKTGTRFLPSTPPEFLALPPGLLKLGLFSFGVVDLAAYADKAALMDAARVATKKKGRITREIARAEHRGYYVHAFQLADFPEDLIAIHGSKTHRDGRAVNDPYYKKDAAHFAGLPRRECLCPQHHHVSWGVFLKDDGHVQNGRVVNERLVAYVSVARRGQCAWYNAMMGHADHLRDGVMYLLHFHIVADAIKARPAGLRYIAYYTLVRWAGDAAARWKYNCLFKPVYFHYVGDRPYLVPDDHLLTHGAEAFDLLEQTITLPIAAAEIVAEARGFSPRQLKMLHQMWVTLRGDQDRIAAILMAGSYPPLDLLRPLAARTFPTEVLDGVSRVVAALNGRCRGLDTLPSLVDRGVVPAVLHSNPVELYALQRTYDAACTFTACAGPVPAAAVAGADLVICDTGFATPENLQVMFDHAKAVLIAAKPTLLQQLPCGKTTNLDRIGQGLGAFTGRPVRCKATFFRRGHPDEQTWLWVEAERPA